MQLRAPCSYERLAALLQQRALCPTCSCRLCPCRQRNIAATYVVILTPTRELAAQIHSMVQNLAQFTDIQVGGAGCCWTLQQVLGAGSGIAAACSSTA